ncbi:MAG: histidine phosphatase family protein [Thermoleophilia bacterium]|nr:histidine phosphatase family protein [Thermoleophilia bacterium]
MASASQIALVRHGQTEWSLNGRHTGRTDVSLTDQGREEARTAAALVQALEIDHVRTSPLARARETCELLNLSQPVTIDADLMEWDYGIYEGITTVEIRETVPTWTVWSQPCLNGETAADVAARVDRVIVTARASEGTTLIVAHGHVLRVLAARWLGLDPGAGRYFRLDTATVSLLGWERETPVILRWNTRGA